MRGCYVGKAALQIGCILRLSPHPYLLPLLLVCYHSRSGVQSYTQILHNCGANAHTPVFTSAMRHISITLPTGRSPVFILISPPFRFTDPHPHPYNHDQPTSTPRISTNRPLMDCNCMYRYLGMAHLAIWFRY